MPRKASLRAPWPHDPSNAVFFVYRIRGKLNPSVRVGKRQPMHLRWLCMRILQGSETPCQFVESVAVTRDQDHVRPLEVFKVTDMQVHYVRKGYWENLGFV